MRMRFSCLLLLIMAIMACRKEGFLTSGEAVIKPLVDTLKFDTVFTKAGSITRRFTLVNPYDQKIKLDRIYLGGGEKSVFKLNINGTPAQEVKDLVINALDSIYIFVKAEIDPTNEANPFLLLDSVMAEYNGRTTKVYLQAFGQNAQYLGGGILDADWKPDNRLPLVITGTIVVSEGVKMEISPGTKLYMGPRAALLIFGTLESNGSADNPVIFTGQRLDKPYSEYPASWPGIAFGETAGASRLSHTHILNSYQAITSIGGAGQIPARLTLDACRIENAYDYGILAQQSSVKAINTLVAQCGNDGEQGVGGSNMIINGGGNYLLNHCTLVTYGGYFQNHKQPVLYISNRAGSNAYPLHFTLNNSIVFGKGGQAEEQIKLDRLGTGVFECNFNQVMYHSKSQPSGIQFSGSFMVEDPGFDSVNTYIRYYNFRLRKTSPGIAKALTAQPLTEVDLDNRSRPTGKNADLGCYETEE